METCSLGFSFGTENKIREVQSAPRSFRLSRRGELEVLASRRPHFIHIRTIEALHPPPERYFSSSQTPCYPFRSGQPLHL
jgi:hypothetical protein